MNKIHISLNVSNLEESINFYELLFDEKVNKVKTDYANFDLNKIPLKLALNKVQELQKNESKLSHLGIQVYNKDYVKKEIERLNNIGLITLEENNTNCCYAIQDKVWVSDPDGNKWEIYVIIDEIENNNKGNSSSCCPDNNIKKEEEKLSKCCS